MKKHLLILSAVVALLCLTLPAQETPHKAIVSTTMDFLDLSGIADYYPPGEDPGYLTLEQYEKCLKKLADAGIKKLYLRVNVTGLMLFPSKAAGTSGPDGGHFASYPDLAARVVKTLEHYNPCTETIRIGHELGMEVWAWENWYDDGAFGEVAHASDSAEKYGIYPLMDKFYRGHPEYMAWHKPDGTLPTMEECAARNRAVEGRHIGRIVFTSDHDCDKPCRLTAANVAVYVSDDNFTWQKYDRPYEFATAREGQRNQVIISGLDIPQRYVKLQSVGMPLEGPCTMIISQHRSPANRVEDTEGKPMPVIWGRALMDINHTTVNPLRHALSFDSLEGGSHAAAWDYGERAIGFATGEPFHPQLNAFTRGMAELTVPTVLQHKLDRFAEIAAYPFDGFVFSTRTHAAVVTDPDLWGYNPEVRDLYLKRYGKDIWDMDFTDYASVQELRAEGLDAFMAGCRKIAGTRPIYAQVPEWPAPENPCADWRNQIYWNSFGSFPFRWQTWVAEGTINGITMISWYNPDYFASVRGKVKLSCFREAWHVLQMGPEAFRKELFERGGNPAVDEIELYESCVYCVEPILLDQVRNYTSSKDGQTRGATELAALKAHVTQPITRAYETGGEKSRFTWVFLGDSVTSGVIHTHGARSFTEIFRNRVCGEKGLSLDTVINSGFSGLDTKLILERGLYESHVRPYHPNAVFIMLGMNDARGVNKLTKAQFQDNIGQLVEKVRADGAIPILMTCNAIEKYEAPDGKPLEEFFKDNAGALEYYKTYLTAYKQLPEFMEAVRTVARERDVILVDNFAHWQKADAATLSSWLGETIHPGARGHIEIAAEIFRVLDIPADGGNSMAARAIKDGIRTDR